MRRQQGGYIFLVAMLTVLVVGIVGLLLSQESANLANRAGRSLDAEKAAYLAQAGLNQALGQIRERGCGPYSDIPATTLGEGSYTASITTNSVGGTTTSYRVPVSADAFVKQDTPTQNYGSDAQLGVNDNLLASTDERALYRFDTGSAGIAPGANILSAVAKFFVLDNTSLVSVGVHQVNADWSENDVNWDSVSSSYQSSSIGLIRRNSVVGAYVSVNITSLVQGWVNGSVPNQGVMLKSTGFLGKDRAVFTSKEYGNADERPVLEITVVTGTLANRASIVATGALANGISRTVTKEDAPLYQVPSRTNWQPGVGLRDAYVDTAKANNNFGAAPMVSVDGGTSHGLVRFNLDALPPSAVVSQATLSLYLEGAATIAGGVLDLHKLTRAWVEGGQNDAAPPAGEGVTYNHYDGTNPWSTPGGDYDATPIDSVTIADATPGWHAWDITEQVQSWWDGEPNHGLLLRASGGTVSKANFTSSDGIEREQRPRLEITFRCECGVACVIPQGAGDILMAVADPSNLSAGEQYKKSLFESWDYGVTLINDNDDQAAFDAALVNADIAYVSETVRSFALANKLSSTAKGVVNEAGNSAPNLGIASSSANSVGNSLTVVDNSHYISALLPSGVLPLYHADMQGLNVAGTLAPDLLTLAEWDGAPGLALVETGGTLHDGSSTAAGRRAMLPLGRDSSFNWRYLNGSGRLLVQRAIQWATGNTGSKDAPAIILSTASAATLGGLDFTDKDLARYDPFLAEATLYLDGAAEGLTQNIDAVHVLENDHILLSTADTASIGGLSISDEDIIDYDPASDSATMVFDGSVLFGTGTADISSVHVMATGHLLLSSDTAATLGGLSFDPADIVEYDPMSNTATMFFDGSAVGLAAGIDAVHLLDDGHIVLSTDAAATLGGLSFDAGDLIEYDPVTGTAVLYFDDAKFASAENLRSVHIGAGSGSLGSAAPIAHWRFDDGTGAVAVDSAGGHHGALINGPAWASGQLDGALNFDGINDRIDVPHHDTLSLTDAMTFTAWINVPSFGSSYNVILSKDAGGAGSNYWFGTKGRELAFGLWAGSAWYDVITSGINLQTGTWYHLAASFDNAADNVRFYVNGAQVHSATLAANPTAVSADLQIGRSPDREYWRGLLDDVRVYDQIIPAMQIAALTAQGIGGGGSGSGGGGGAACNGTFRDEFNAQSFANNDGTLSWSGNWLEVGESDGPTSNDVRVASDLSQSYRLQLQDNDNGGEGVEREANLTGAASATLSFDYRRTGLDSSSDYVKLEISPNGTSGPWTELTQFKGSGNDGAYQAYSKDISAYISATTRIRLITSKDMGGSDQVWFDNIQIQCGP